MAKVGRLVKESSAHEVGASLSERPNFFIANVGRLSAPETDSFRQKLHASQARLLMVKRRLGLRVVEPLKLTGLSELLEGSIGFILSGDDVLLTAKIVVEFRKGREEQLAVRGAVIDGQLWDPARVEQLAKLPPKPVLLAEVVGMLESPIAGVIFTIEQLIGEVAWLAEQAAEKKPAAPAPAAAPPAAAENALATTETKTTTEPGPTPTGGVGEGSPDAAGGGTPPKPEEGTPS